MRSIALVLICLALVGCQAEAKQFSPVPAGTRGGVVNPAPQID